MTHSATIRTDLPWNQPGSLGFYISQRHMGVSRMTRRPLIQERAGGLKTAFQRHGEFAGRALARMAAHPFPDSRSIRDSRDGKFVYLAGQFGRRGSAGATSLGMRELPIMRYPGGTVVTSQGASGLKKSEAPHIGAPTSGVISGAAADYAKQMGIAGTHMAQAQQMSAVQQILMPRRSTREESSLNGPQDSRSQDDSASLPDFRRSASASAVNASTVDDPSGKQEQGRRTAETALSPVLPESADITGVHTPGLAMPDMTGSGNAGLPDSSGNFPRFAPGATGTATARVMRHLQRDIAPHRQLPLPLNRSIPGISPISPVSRPVARQAGSFEADRVANMNPAGVIHAGIQAEGHAKPGAVKPERPLSYHGQLLLRPMRIGMESSVPEPAPGAPRRQPERNVQVVSTDMQRYRANEGHATGQARSLVLARQPVPNAPVSLETHETHETHKGHEAHEASNRNGNAKSIISKAAASENAEAPDDHAALGLGDAVLDSLILPAVLPASLSRAVQRQAAAQGFPHGHDFPGAHHAETSFPLQSRPGGSKMRSSRMDTRSSITRSPAAAQAAAPMAKHLGNRNGNSARADFPVPHAAPPRVLCAADRADGSGRVASAGEMAPAVAGGGGGGGKEGNFLARAPGLERPALSAGGAGGRGSRLSLSQSSSLAGSRLLSGGIYGRELLPPGPERLPGAPSSTTGEWQTRDATLRRAATASPATVSGPGFATIPVIHAPTAVDGALRPDTLPSSDSYPEIVQRKSRFASQASAGSPALFPVFRAFGMQAGPWTAGRDGMEAGFDEGKPASPSRAVSRWTDTAARPFVLAHRAPQVRRAQRAEAGMGEGEAAWSQIMRLTDDANGGAIHSLPLARQEAPEDRYGLVPAPHSGPGGVRGAPGSEGAAAESSIGKPDADEMAEQTWRLISERLVIEQERRGLASWSR
jgi:hypothetical protein